MVPVPFASWSVLTADFLTVLYLAFGGVVFSALLQLSGARWHYEVRRVGLALSALCPLAFVLLVVLLAARETTFPWLEGADHAAGWSAYSIQFMGRAVTVTLPSWHNYIFLVARELGAFMLVSFLFARYMKLMKQSDHSMVHWRRFRRISYWVPVIFVAYGTLIAWDFEMTMQPEWHSAIYGMYHLIGNFGMFLSFMLILVYLFAKNGIMVKRVPEYIYSYIAQLLLAFTLLWVYTFFAQFLTIWYGNLPHEMNRVADMAEGDYAGLWWTVIVLKFAVPFLVLIFEYARHTPHAIAGVAACIFAGGWIERYIWISGAYPAGPYVPGYMPMTGLFDIAATAVVALAGFALVRGALLRERVICRRGVPAQA